MNASVQPSTAMSAARGRSRRRHRRDGAHAEGRQGQADDAAQAREQQALDQELPDDLEPRRAEGEAHGDLRLPRRGARQQHVRDVGAGDQQDEADRDEQHREAEPRVADDALLERHRPARRGSCPERRFSRAVTRSTSAWAAAGSTPGFSRAKTRRLLPLAAVAPAVERQRRPQLRLRRPERREHEARRHHADDRVGSPSRRIARPTMSAVAAEPLLPQAVADHDACALRRLGRRPSQQPAMHRRDAEQPQRLGRHAQSLDALGRRRQPRFGDHISAAPIASNERVWARQSRKLAGATGKRPSCSTTTRASGSA